MTGQEKGQPIVPNGKPKNSERRLTLLVALTAFWFFLIVNHGHFIGSDEVAVFYMTQSIVETGNLAVPAMQHTAVGPDGQRYSFFTAGQSFLAAPLYALGQASERWLPPWWQRAVRGPDRGYGPYVFGGTLEIAFVSLYSSLASALLIALFFRFERRLGVSRRNALIVAGLLASCTYVLLLSTYFLRHAAEAAALLGAFYYFFLYKETGSPWNLVFGSGLASLAFLLRVPAGLVAPALALYVAYILFLRSDRGRNIGVLLGGAVAVLVPLAIAIALHAAMNEAKWGTLIGSPMVAQYSRLKNPIYIGLAGFLISPGASVFVYTPLLLLLPFTLPPFFESHKAECVTFAGLSLFLLLVYSTFDGWEGLWSAPGPRYLSLLTPLLMLPVGGWLDRGGGALRWSFVAVLGAAGLFVQVVSTVVSWGVVPAFANYRDFVPRWSFLFIPQFSPVAEMTRLFFDGGPYDPWLIQLGEGWAGFPGQPGLAWGLFAGWGLILAVGLVWVGRESLRLEATD